MRADTHRRLSPLVFLPIDPAAVAILRAIQAILLALGEMAVVLGLIDTFAFRNIGVVLFVARSLSVIHRAVGQALIDARLLIVESLVTSLTRG